MRLFVALVLPERVPAELARRLAAAKRSCPPAKWVRAETMHVTVAFLGEVGERMAATLDAVLRPIFAAAPRLDVRFAGTGAFPRRNRARVVWCGMEPRPDEALPRLHQHVTQALATLDDERGERFFEPENRPYRPHVTLAYCRPPWSESAVDTLTAAMAGPRLGGTITDGALFESTLQPSGAHYRVVSTYPLGMATDVERIV